MLFNAERRAKDDAVFQALGSTDELNACVGIARAHAEDCEAVAPLPGQQRVALHNPLAGLVEQLGAVQSRLFDVGSAVATPRSPFLASPSRRGPTRPSSRKGAANGPASGGRSGPRASPASGGQRSAPVRSRAAASAGVAYQRSGSASSSAARPSSPQSSKNDFPSRSSPSKSGFCAGGVGRASVRKSKAPSQRRASPSGFEKRLRWRHSPVRASAR